MNFWLNIILLSPRRRQALHLTFRLCATVPLCRGRPKKSVNINLIVVGRVKVSFTSKMQTEGAERLFASEGGGVPEPGVP